MPGLIMSNLPSDPQRRTGPNFSETTTHTQPTPSSRTCPPFSTSPMTISAGVLPISTASGLAQQHGGASNAMMSAASSGRVLRPVERLRLRDWLIRMVETKAIPGLQWMDRERQVVKIPWKHAARHGWSRDKDACLFRAWAIHTKKYDPSSDSPKANPKVWKANFRCAINSLPDIEELRSKGKSKGNDAYKVYRLHPKRSRRQNRDCSGSKPTKRQRSTSKARSTKSDKKQKKKDSSINASESLPRVPDHSISTKSDGVVVEDLLKKRMAEISPERSMPEQVKRDHMSLNVGVRYVYKPNGTTITSPSPIKSPTTPYSITSPTIGPHHFQSSNSFISTVSHSTCKSPCSTTTSTPASTPQTPPPPYQLAVRQRHGTGFFNVQARFDINPTPSHHGYDGYVVSDECSDSDSSHMTEADVANIIWDIKEQSCNNSPRSVSPLDGNNNMDTTITHGEGWAQHKQHSDAVFCDNVLTHANRQMIPKGPVYQTDFGAGLMGTQIKMEPEPYLSVMSQHQGGILNGYETSHLSGLPPSNEIYDGQSADLMYHQL